MRVGKGVAISEATQALLLERQLGQISDGSLATGSPLNGGAGSLALVGTRSHLPRPVMQLRDFKGGQLDRFTMDWNPTLRSPDDELRRSLRRMRARARQLARDSDLIDAFRELLVTNVLGPQGMRLIPKVLDAVGNPDKKSNQKISDAFRRWWEGPVTIDGQLSGPEVEPLLLKTRSTDGETFGRWHVGSEYPCGLALEPIDADMLDERFSKKLPGGGEVRLGIEVDAKGRPLRYHFAGGPYWSQSWPQVHERAPIPASEIFHLFRRSRINQARGYTDFASVMWVVNMLDAYLEGEMVASRANANNMGFITHPGDGAPTGTADGAPQQPAQMDAPAGTVWDLPRNSEFEAWKPDHPVAAFADFIGAIERRIATGLKVGFWELCQNYADINLSSIRGGILAVRDHWRMEQGLWICQFKRPLFEKWLSCAIPSGALKLDSPVYSRYLEHGWQGRGWPWPDPLKDAQAAKLWVGLGVDSRHELVGEDGSTFEERFAELELEEKLAREKGVPIHGEDPGARQSSKAAEDAQALEDAAATAAQK